MNDSDVGYSFEWEVEFLEWIKSKGVNKESNPVFEDYPQIKKEYSENFILDNFFYQNNEN